jgi:hypothetical protein
MRNRTHALLAAAVVAAIVAGCGGSHTTPIQPAAHIYRPPGAKAARIVVTARGARLIGLQTAPAHRAGGPTVTIPYSALIYDPSGKAYAFVAVGRLAYQQVPVKVAHIDGPVAYLDKGPHAGSQVVSIGAEELYGVQTGVLGQT